MKYFYSDELSYYKSICYMVSLQEFLKSKNVKYLFFQPWCDILSSEKRLQTIRNNKSKFSDWLSEPVPGLYPKKLGIGDIIKDIDKKYVIGPYVLHHKLETRHPNKEEHKLMAKFIKEKILEVYP